MGGYYSGRWRWHQKRVTVEEALHLSVKDIVRYIGKENMTERVQASGSWAWTYTRTGKQAASISMEFDSLKPPPLLILSYTVTHADGSQHPQRIKVWMESMPCQYGGVRWWFKCPRCNRRIGKLYKPYQRLTFACRHCHDLTYTSAQEAHKYDRGSFAAMFVMLDKHERIDKLVKRLEGKHYGSKNYVRIRAKLDALRYRVII